MREMKDSGIEWIGKIPKDWNLTKAKYCIVIHNGTNPRTDGNIPVYGSGSANFKTCGEFKNGPAVLLGRKGSINIPHYVEGKYWNIDTAFDVRAKNNIKLKYYFYLAESFDYDYYMSQTTLPSMTQSNYENMIIPLPSITAQNTIANFLDSKCSDIDALISDIESQIDMLEQYKRSVITEAVTKGLNPDTEMKDSGVEWIGEIPKDWEICRVKDHYTVHTGFTPNTTKRAYYDDAEYDWVNISDIVDGNILYETKNKISDIYLNKYHPQIVPKGSLLYSFKLSVGQTAYAGKDLYTNEAIASFWPKKDINLHFLRYSSSLIIENAQTNIYNAKILNKQLINNAHIVFPPLEEQQQIADYLDEKCSNIDAIFEGRKAELATLKEYKKSLIYEYVTGKKEVPMP